MEIEKTQEW
jgi:hypothetical protein